MESPVESRRLCPCTDSGPFSRTVFTTLLSADYPQFTDSKRNASSSRETQVKSEIREIGASTPTSEYVSELRGDMPVEYAPDKGTWQLLKGALSGCKVDYTSGDLNRVIILLAVPMMLEMALQSVFSVTDIYWVSRLGSDAVASVGLTESLLTLIFAISSGLSTSATALVARRIGEHDTERAAIDAVQAICIGLAVSVALGVPLFFAAPKLLGMMGATPNVVRVGMNYARISLGACGVIIMLSLNNAIFRGAGDAVVAMRLLWAANGINLVLDPLLIYGVGPFPKLGVTGPAVGTLIGRGTIVLYQFYRLNRGTERFRIAAKHLKFNFGEARSFLRVSAAGMAQFLLEQGSWLGLVRIVSLFGAAALAGYTVGVRVVGFVLLPSIGLSNAAATLVGQNVGAGAADRAKASVWRTSFLNFAFLGTISLLFIIFARPLISPFSHDEAVRKTAVECLRFFSAGNLMFAFAAVFLQAFNGAGDTLTPTYINLFGFWVVEIPLAWWLARHTPLQLRGVFVAVLVAQAVALLCSGLLFIRGGWAEAKV